jgi:hypothetical protein
VEVLAERTAPLEAMHLLTQAVAVAVAAIMVLGQYQVLVDPV